MKTKAKKGYKILLKTLLVFFALIISSVFGLFAFYFSVTSGITLNAQALSLENKRGAEILDDNNNIVYYIGGNSTIKLKDLPQNVINAFISMEDKKFYSHSGIDFHRMVGALVNNIKNGKFKQGGSTISQQLVKNTFLSSDKTFTR